MPEGSHDPETIRAALDEVLGWPGIARSPQLAELLRYVVEKTIAGDGAGIKAYSIAVDVFGRPTDFDPQSDPIVRVQARRLRALLEQFYEGGNGTAEVQIRLPLGRYVPEFNWNGPRSVAGGTGEAEPPPEQEPRGEPADEGPSPQAAKARVARRRTRKSYFLLNATLGLVFTLAGVALSAAIIFWMMPQWTAVAPPGTPEIPVVTVGTFDNLTGDQLLDDDVKAIGARLREALGRFDDLRVGDGGMIVRGTVQLLNGNFVLRATLTSPQTNNADWQTTIQPNMSGTDTEELTLASTTLAAQIGNASGPLHARGRAWLKLQTQVPTTPTSYVCNLYYMVWRDTRRLEDAENATTCYDRVLEATPDDAMALAAWAGMGSWIKQFLASPVDDLSRLMEEYTAAAGRAVSLKPDDSFVYEQQAVVLARQHSVDAALGAIIKATELNPASMDAVSLRGTMLWLGGQYAEGMLYGERALSAIPSPPSWYFLTRGFNALREQRFFDAIDAAQALTSGDEEFGPAIALAAAPRAARSDLIDRYRPMVMSNPRFQAAGILPRLKMRIRSESTLARFREGLILAGIPPNALDRPFNPDGSERLTPNP